MDWTRTPDFDLSMFTHFSILNSHGQDLVTWLTGNVSFMWLLVSAAYLLLVSMFEPIACLCPAEFSDPMCNYTISYCWTSAMYILDYDEEIPMDKGERHVTAKHKVAYYPMVPFILMGVALALNFPKFIWSACVGEQGLDIHKAVDLGREPRRRDQASEAVAFEISFPFIKDKHSHKKRMRLRKMLTNRLAAVEKFIAALGIFPLGSGLGAYQTGLFMFTRILAVALCIATFKWLNFALDTNYVAWGWEHVLWAATGEKKSWLDHIFPDETLCDFRIRQLSNIQMYTIQCVLHINMLSEKVFIFLWFWLVLLVLVNLYSYQYWFRKLIFSSSRRRLVSKHMRTMEGEAGRRTREEVTDFALNYLTHDSVLVLKMLEVCVGNQFVDAVVKLLWKEFKNPNSVEDHDQPAVEPPARRFSQPVEEAEQSL